MGVKRAALRLGVLWGSSALALLIGGPDGLAPELREKLRYRFANSGICRLIQIALWGSAVGYAPSSAE